MPRYFVRKKCLRIPAISKYNIYKSLVIPLAQPIYKPLLFPFQLSRSLLPILCGKHCQHKQYHRRGRNVAYWGQLLLVLPSYGSLAPICHLGPGQAFSGEVTAFSDWCVPLVKMRERERDGTLAHLSPLLQQPWRETLTSPFLSLFFSLSPLFTLLLSLFLSLALSSRHLARSKRSHYVPLPHSSPSASKGCVR